MVRSPSAPFPPSPSPAGSGLASLSAAVPAVAGSLLQSLLNPLRSAAAPAAQPRAAAPPAPGQQPSSFSPTLSPAGSLGAPHAGHGASGYGPTSPPGSQASPIDWGRYGDTHAAATTASSTLPQPLAVAAAFQADGGMGAGTLGAAGVGAGVEAAGAAPVRSVTQPIDLVSNRVSGLLQRPEGAGGGPGAPRNLMDYLRGGSVAQQPETQQQQQQQQPQQQRIDPAAWEPGSTPYWQPQPQLQQQQQQHPQQQQQQLHGFGSASIDAGTGEWQLICMVSPRKWLVIKSNEMWDAQLCTSCAHAQHRHSRSISRLALRPLTHPRNLTRSLWHACAMMLTL